MHNGSIPETIMDKTYISCVVLIYGLFLILLSIYRMQLQMISRKVHSTFRGSLRCTSNLPQVTCQSMMVRQQKRRSLNLSTRIVTSLSLLKPIQQRMNYRGLIVFLQVSIKFMLLGLLKMLSDACGSIKSSVTSSRSNTGTTTF